MRFEPVQSLDVRARLTLYDAPTTVVWVLEKSCNPFVTPSNTVW
jgi:hypothetical protein